MSVKEQVRQLLDGLPDDASLDDIMHALYVRAKSAKGRGFPTKRPRSGFSGNGQSDLVPRGAGGC